MGLMYVAYRTLTRSLRDGETIRELIVQNASDGIFVVSPQGATLSWNPAMERITGFAENEAVGRDWRDVLGATAWHGNAAAATEPKGMLRFAPVRRRDGSERWVRYATNPLAGAQSKGHATVVVMHDATAEYEAERLKSDFIASISHELRTPLTPLKGFLQVLISGTADNTEEARQEYYRIMLRQATRLETLVNQLLDLSRFETEGPSVEDGPVDLVALAGEHVRAFAEQQPDRRIHLLATGRPPVVRGDPRSIGLVLSNLMSNALKYSNPETVVTIDLSATEESAVVSVRDQGGGIAAGDQPRVFERFFQGRNRRIGDGVGLGLHIAKRLVEAGGGDIWFESSLEEGSTFHFSIPLPSGNGAAATSNGLVVETPPAEPSAHRVEA
jgi:PAS domain S-box-containing protein